MTLEYGDCARCLSNMSVDSRWVSSVGSRSRVGEDHLAELFYIRPPSAVTGIVKVGRTKWVTTRASSQKATRIVRYMENSSVNKIPFELTNKEHHMQQVEAICFEQYRLTIN